MRLDKHDIPIHTADELLDFLYTEKYCVLDNFVLENDIDINKWNEYAAQFDTSTLTIHCALDIDQTLFDQYCQSNWYMPDDYKHINLHSWCLNKCNTTVECNRVEEELAIYNKKNLFDLLRYMIYLVDIMKENKVIWGVGRGSSVASFVLYLIGIHKINPITHDLDWREFLR